MSKSLLIPCLFSFSQVRHFCRTSYHRILERLCCIGCCGKTHEKRKPRLAHLAVAVPWLVYLMPCLAFHLFAAA